MYYKLHLLVYLLEYMKMHGPGNIKLKFISLMTGNFNTCSGMNHNSVTAARSVPYSKSFWQICPPVWQF
jgi:hypothetical protein